MTRRVKWLVCRLCGRMDVTHGAHVGTQVSMRCPDCAVECTGYATLCRDCCVTKHGTEYREETQDVR